LLSRRARASGRLAIQLLVMNVELRNGRNTCFLYLRFIIILTITTQGEKLLHHWWYMYSESQVEATRQRYAERMANRSRNRRLIDEGQILKADTPDRIEKFFERRGFSESVVKKMIRGEELGLPYAEVAAAAEPDRPDVLERILGTSDLIGVSFLQAGLNVARTVARIWVRVQSGRPAGFGTGFLISPRLLMTNNHVLRTAADAQSSLAEFDYELDLQGLPVTSIKMPLDPARFFFTDAHLDYSVVAIADGSEAQRALAARGYNQLIAEEGKAIIAQYLNIIQHPGGEPKQLSLRQNQMVDILPDFLHYMTDTAPGSSGSPVFNDRWEIVAVHHSGVPATNDAGQTLTIDNQIWRRAMGEDRIKWIANEGARISRVIASLKQQTMATAQRALLEIAFQPPSSAPLAFGRGDTEIASSSTGGSNSAASMDSDGTATWTIPLTVSVRLGAHSATACRGGAAPALIQPDTSAVSSAPTVKPTPEGDEQAIWKRALEEWVGRDDVIAVRLGYVFENGWITNKRALVVTVREKLPMAELRRRNISPMPEAFHGMPVEIVGPTIAELLEERLGPEVTEALLPTDAPTVDEITYEPPDVELKKFVNERMHVVAHCSPDVGWTNLSEFLKDTNKRLVVGMYDFGAKHILKSIMKLSEKASFKDLFLVMQFGESLEGETKADDLGDAEVVDQLEDAFEEKFHNAWVKIGSVNGWVAYSYHIKVAVRDQSAFWLSSGNWQSSNQPKAEPLAESPPDFKWLAEYNREWHCIVEHPEMAQTFEAHLMNDFENNEAIDPTEAAPFAELQLPELLVPVSAVFPLERVAAFTYFDAFDETRDFTVEPLLTPDNYHERVLDLIEGAEEEILFQNQTLNLPKPSHQKLQELLDALLEKQNQGVEVRFIFRLFRKADAIQTLNGLKDMGFDTDKVKVQPNCHTKGIIVDRQRVLIGSHNWSNAGVSVNRDASLLFDDKKLAEYFAGIFEHDWTNLATQDLGPNWEPVEWADAAATTPPTMMRLSVQELLEMV
jgi:V8-like Glu-specific endopeptidase